MKKQELLKLVDEELLEKLFVFCYARTKDSYEAQELCSDIVYALVQTANTEGEITDSYSYIWKIARNVYADFCNNRSWRANIFYEGDPEKIFPLISNDAEMQEQDDTILLNNVYNRIAFLTRAYREVMVAFYLDGLSTKDIAKMPNTSETAIRQRL
ncbi:MAG: sigma-70 family RNA polymerase sigma factor, partial [Lachnospiraceae bacterium]|nr:sigma-70 family RNA polymerase sigma factor [Lachnospiraceae bacterium]